MTLSLNTVFTLNMNGILQSNHFGNSNTGCKEFREELQNQKGSANQNKNKIMFTTCPKHVNQQRINCQMLAKLKKLWICLVFFQLYHTSNFPHFYLFSKRHLWITPETICVALEHPQNQYKLFQKSIKTMQKSFRKLSRWQHRNEF